MGGAGEVGRVGVGEGDVPTGGGVVLPLLVVFGVVLGDGLGDEPVDDDGAAAGAGRELVVDPAGAGVGEAVGLVGDPSGPPGRRLEAFEALPQQGVAVA